MNHPHGERPPRGVVPSAPPASALAADVREGLYGTPKRLLAKYLYDELGSLLFEAICALPWYRVTRAEMALLAACAPQIAHHVAGEPFIVELGPGNGDKLLRLAEAFGTRPRKPHLHLIDISSSALAAAEQALAQTWATSTMTRPWRSCDACARRDGRETGYCSARASRHVGGLRPARAVAGQ